MSVVTSRFAKRLKTIELYIKASLNSQIESSEYKVAVPTWETAPKLYSGVSFCICGSRMTLALGPTFVRSQLVDLVMNAS